MALKSAEQYRNVILTLLPPGSAWQTTPESNLSRLLLAFSDEFSRVDQRGIDLIEEADPRSVFELLNEWESILGLPDDCLGIAATLTQRQEAIATIFTAIGSQSMQYFIDLAATLGFADVTINEFEQHSVEMTVDDPVTGYDWIYAWQVSVPQPDIAQFRVDSSVDESLGDESPTQRLECLINRLKPAHTVAIFNYT